MLILTIRTDKPEAEIGLFENTEKLVYLTWPAHRELAETIHTKIRLLLEEHSKQLKEIGGLVVFKGPGSFTGLRIGASVADTFADSLKVPIVGTTGEKWISDGIAGLTNGQNDATVMPEYGAEPHITAPRK